MDSDHDKYLDIINELQKAKIGEPARIADIRERLLAGKTVYDSDRNYLDGQYDRIDKSNSEQAGDPEGDNKTDTASDERIKNLEEELAKIKKTDKSSKNEYYGTDRSDSERMRNLEEKITETGGLDQSQRISLMKGEGTTLLLAILPGLIGLYGIGHLYVGQTVKGAGLLIAGIIVIAMAILASMSGVASIIDGTAAIGLLVSILLIITYAVLFFWQIFDSRKQCKKYNDFLLETGKRMW